MSDPRPLGVFDSGVGGLTVLRELRRRLPSEELIYLADERHFPYGPRHHLEVRDFALRIIDHLVHQDVKLVVIACNTATAAALGAAREYFDIPVVGVITPGAQAAVRRTQNGRVAVISTAGTWASGQYPAAISDLDPSVEVLSRAAPGLVEIVEAGEADTPRADQALHQVLAEVFEWGADTLVLGCTHYPLLAGALDRLAGTRLALVDSAETTADKVGRVLLATRMVSEVALPSPPRLLVTGAPHRFLTTARRLFGDSVPLPTVIRLDGDVEPGAAGAG